jgi:hypothetical protein
LNVTFTAPKLDPNSHAEECFQQHAGTWWVREVAADGMVLATSNLMNG